MFLVFFGVFKHRCFLYISIQSNSTFNAMQLFVLDRIHTNFSTNSTHYHAWSPFLMVYVVTAIIISIFNTSSTLNIHLNSQDSCECNCQFFCWNIPIFDIVMFSRVCNYFLVFHKTRDPILLIVSYALSISSISYYDLVGIITSWWYKSVNQI